MQTSEWDTTPDRPMWGLVLLGCHYLHIHTHTHLTYVRRWKKEFYELQSKYLPYQDQIDQLVSRIKGLQSQSDLAESEVRIC